MLLSAPAIPSDPPDHAPCQRDAGPENEDACGKYRHAVTSLWIEATTGYSKPKPGPGLAFPTLASPRGSRRIRVEIAGQLASEWTGFPAGGLVSELVVTNDFLTKDASKATVY